MSESLEEPAATSASAAPAPSAVTERVDARPPESFLEVRDLRVHFPTDDGLVKSVDGLTFGLERGRTLGIVGESGSGKSVTSLAILGLHKGGHARISGQIWLDGRAIQFFAHARLEAGRPGQPDDTVGSATIADGWEATLPPDLLGREAAPQHATLSAPRNAEPLAIRQDEIKSTDTDLVNIVYQVLRSVL